MNILGIKMVPILYPTFYSVEEANWDKEQCDLYYVSQLLIITEECCVGTVNVPRGTYPACNKLEGNERQLEALFME